MKDKWFLAITVAILLAAFGWLCYSAAEAPKIFATKVEVGEIRTRFDALEKCMYQVKEDSAVNRKILERQESRYNNGNAKE